MQPVVSHEVSALQTAQFYTQLKSFGTGGFNQKLVAGVLHTFVSSSPVPAQSSQLSTHGLQVFAVGSNTYLGSHTLHFSVASHYLQPVNSHLKHSLPADS